MHKTEIECDDPLEWVQVQRTLQTGNRSDILSLAEEAHAYVIPQLARVWIVNWANSVLQQSGIMVSFILNYRAGGQNSFRVLWISGQRRSQVLKSLIILAHSYIEKADCRQDFAILRWELKCLNVDINSALVVLFNLVHLSKLNISAIMFMDGQRPLKVLYSFIVNPKEFTA